jgi:hypothetical protein
VTNSRYRGDLEATRLGACDVSRRLYMFTLIARESRPSPAAGLIAVADPIEESAIDALEARREDAASPSAGRRLMFETPRVARCRRFFVREQLRSRPLGGARPPVVSQRAQEGGLPRCQTGETPIGVATDMIGSHAVGSARKMAR